MPVEESAPSRPRVRTVRTSAALTLALAFVVAGSILAVGGAPAGVVVFFGVAAVLVGLSAAFLMPAPRLSVSANLRTV